MSSSDILTINSNTLVEQFCHCVDGKISGASIAFLGLVNQSNAPGLRDLIKKLSHIQIKAPGELLDTMVQIFNDGLTLPDNTLACIEDFLKVANKAKILNELQSLETLKSKLPQSVFKIMNNFNIFANESLAAQWLKTVIGLTLGWKATNLCANQEAEDKLKAMFGIPDLSIMAKITHLIVAVLQLSDNLIDGKIRQINGLELFFLFKKHLNNSKAEIACAFNKQLIQQLYASALAAMIYKKSPNSYYDIVIWQAQHQDFAILNELSACLSKPMILEQFQANSLFKPYYPQLNQDSYSANRYVLLSSLATYLQILINNDAPERPTKFENIIYFAKQCHQEFCTQDKPNFLKWYGEHVFFKEITPMSLNLVLEMMLSIAVSQKNNHQAQIRASAMQLVGMGYSHRSIASVSTGVFNPMIHSDIGAIDVTNIIALIDFLNQQAQAIKVNLLKELLLVYTFYQPTPPLRNQAIESLQPSKTQQLDKMILTKAHSIIPLVFRANPLNSHGLFTRKEQLDSHSGVENTENKTKTKSVENPKFSNRI